MSVTRSQNSLSSSASASHTYPFGQRGNGGDSEASSSSTQIQSIENASEAYTRIVEVKNSRKRSLMKVPRLFRRHGSKKHHLAVNSFNQDTSSVPDSMYVECNHSDRVSDTSIDERLANKRSRLHDTMHYHDEVLPVVSYSHSLSTSSSCVSSRVVVEYVEQEIEEGRDCSDVRDEAEGRCQDSVECILPEDGMLMSGGDGGWESLESSQQWYPGWLADDPWNAAKRGDLIALQIFAEGDHVAKVDWTKEDEFESTPLYYACHSGASGKHGLRAVRYLLQIWPGQIPPHVLDRCKKNALNSDVIRLLNWASNATSMDHNSGPLALQSMQIPQERHDIFQSDEHSTSFLYDLMKCSDDDETCVY